MILLDGSQGEGGGQILRTALGLSLCTGQPFRIEKVRAGREKAGLLRQHLTAVTAAAAVGAAEVEGATLGSRELTFRPGKAGIAGGEFSFAVVTAGSAGLVLQTVLPALARGIATRELAIVRERLGWTEEQCEVDELPAAYGPGNALILEVANEQLTEIFSGFGQRGVAAERVATQVTQEVRDYLVAPGAPAVGEHLADQLLIPLALASGGAFSTVSPSRHTVTNVETINRFLPHVRFELREPSGDDQAWAVVITGGQ